MSKPNHAHGLLQTYQAWEKNNFRTKDGRKICNYGDNLEMTNKFPCEPSSRKVIQFYYKICHET